MLSSPSTACTGEQPTRVTSGPLENGPERRGLGVSLSLSPFTPQQESAKMKRTTGSDQRWAEDGEPITIGRETKRMFVGMRYKVKEDQKEK